MPSNNAQNRPSHLAIRIGSSFAHVIVDAGKGQCRAPHVDSGYLFRGGTTDESIMRAARDPYGVRFDTLDELMASTSGTVVRRHDLDVD